MDGAFLNNLHEIGQQFGVMLHAWWPDAQSGLWALGVVCFLSATILPGGSEAAVVAFALAHPQDKLLALAVATFGNTLGGMSSYVLGRLLPARADLSRLVWVQRYGSVSQLLSWLPLVGDALCAAAGWLRLPWLPCAIWMAIGKGLRYAALLWLVS